MKGREVRQHEYNECAAACLTTILNMYGCRLPLIAVRERMKMDKKGASVLSIVKTAELYIRSTKT